MSRAKRADIGRFQIFVLLAIQALGKEASCARIAKMIGEYQEVQPRHGQVFVATQRMAERMLLERKEVEKVQKRQGPNDVIYSLTPQGEHILEETRHIFLSLISLVGPDEKTGSDMPNVLKGLMEGVSGKALPFDPLRGPFGSATD